MLKAKYIFLNKNEYIFTKGNLKISNGYEGVYNKNYIEILPKQIIFKNIEIPFHLRWKKEKSETIEYRSKDYCKLRIIFNKNKNRYYVKISDVKQREPT